MEEVIRKIEASLKQGLKVVKKRSAQKLEKIHGYAIWAWGFVGACFREGGRNFFNSD